MNLNWVSRPVFRGCAAMLVGTMAAVGMTETHAQLRGPKGDSPDEKKSTVRVQRDEVLNDLFQAKPEMKDRIKKAAGYATFKSRDINLLLMASGSGYGVLVDNQSGAETFMRVASLGAGVGMGIKDLRVVFIFNDRSVMESWIRDGWQFGGKADTSLKYKDTGAAADASAQATPDFKAGTVAGTTSGDVRAGAADQGSGSAGVAAGGPMEIYQFTESGVSLQATVAGTKYWKDKKLND